MNKIQKQIDEFNQSKLPVEIVYRDFGQKTLVENGIIKDCFRKGEEELILLETGLAIKIESIISIKKKGS